MMRTNEIEQNLTHQRSLLLVNLSNLIANWKYISKNTKQTEVAATVKANAYGLGVHHVTNSLINEGCSTFFVANAKEALEVRNINKDIKIYLLNGTNSFKIASKLVKKDIIIVANQINDLKILEKVAAETMKKLPCAIHLDTGMNRLGLSASDLKDYDCSKFNSLLELRLVMSHLACSEDNKSNMNITQADLFDHLTKKLVAEFNPQLSLANSNGIFLGERYHYNMVRTGAALYGINKPDYNQCIKTVASLFAKIIQIRYVDKGRTIGYGAKYKAREKMKIAILELGYADGLPRNYNGFAYIKGKKVPFVGNISMDSSHIDVSNISDINLQDMVEIFGSNISIDDSAKKSETIAYEIISRLGSRVKRSYKI